MKSKNYKIKTCSKPVELSSNAKNYKYVITVYDTCDKRHQLYYTNRESAEYAYTRMLQEISQEKAQPEERQSAKDVLEFREATAYAESIGMTLDDMVNI